MISNPPHRFDPATPLAERVMDSELAGEVLLDIIKAREGASIIRLGDGEGVLLSGTGLDHPLLGEYLISHFGTQISAQEITRLCNKVDAAVSDATMLGLRTDVLNESPPIDFSASPERFMTQFKSHFQLRPVEHEKIQYKPAYRLATLNAYLYGNRSLHDRYLTSAWCHFDWLTSGLLSRILLGENRIGLISNRHALVPIMEKHGIEVDFYPVPSKFNERKKGWVPHYPHHHDQLVDDLQVKIPGQVFMVGAGIIGKSYCHEIARQGGIAIDIGSVCDAWLGLATRRLVLRAKWGLDSVPDECLLEQQLSRVSGPKTEGAFES